MSFYEQLVKLCEKGNIKPTTLVETLGMSKGTMTNWKKGGSPNADAVVRIAEHFSVSTDYLLLGKKSAMDLSLDDEDWISLLHQLPLEKRAEFKGEIKGYLRRMREESAAAEAPLPKAR